MNCTSLHATTTVKRLNLQANVLPILMAYEVMVCFCTPPPLCHQTAPAALAHEITAATHCLQPAPDSYAAAQPCRLSLQKQVTSAALVAA
jgi:hypothetical protein